MFLKHGLTGRSLAAGQLCLTFDDGPGIPEDPSRGPRTVELAEYLADEGVPAAFFVVGKHVESYPGIVERLLELGHLVGNHTNDHANLVDVHRVGGDVTRQVAGAAATLPSDEPAGPTYFRPPYGAWSPAVAKALNDDVLTAARHVGPVMWDIDGRDWEAWRSRSTPSTCAANYERAVTNAGRGIVLLHDSTADGDVLRSHNQTFAMVRALVPRLRRLGYDFVGLDDVPDLAAAPRGAVALEGLPVVLRPEGHRRVSLVTQEGPLVVHAGSPGRLSVTDGPATPFEVVALSLRQVCLRAPTGRLLGRVDRSGELLLGATRLGHRETFTCVLQPDEKPDTDRFMAARMT